LKITYIADLNNAFYSLTACCQKLLKSLHVFMFVRITLNFFFAAHGVEKENTAK